MRIKWSAGFFWKSVILTVMVINLLIPSRAYAYQVVNKTSSEETITQGAVLQTIKMNTDEGPLNVYILKADLSSPYLKVDTLIGSDGTLNKNQSVLDMAKRTGAVAAVNGDFFQMKESGRTIGLAYQGGHLVESPALRNDMYGFGLTKDSVPILDIFGFSGQVTAGNGKSFPLSGINKPGYLVMSDASSDIDAMTLYNSIWGSTSRGKLPNLTGVVEVVVKNGVVQQVLTDQPGVPIPSDGYILKGHGLAAQFVKDNLPVGSKVNFTYSVTPQGDKLLAAVGGQALLVEDGHLPSYFSQNITGNNARTAVGISMDNKTLYLVGVEKQSASDGTLVSRGMSQEELASFLISIGVWRAVNLDGGGSTTVAARHSGDFNVSLINQPQGISLRPVPVSIGLFSTAPKGNLSGLVISGPSVLLVGTKGEFLVKGGYDQYYNPVQVGQGSITWSTSSAGDFQGNIFVPKQSGMVNVRAALGNASGIALVRVIGPDSLSNLVVTPSTVTVEPGQTAQLSAQVKTKDGETFDLRNQEVHWVVDNSLGQVVDGKFTAVNQTTSGEIKATFQGLSVSIPVSVKSPWEELQTAPERDSEMSMDNWIKIQFPAGSVAEPAKVRVAYADNPSDLPSGCVPLGTVTVNPVQGQETDLTAPWRMNWQYSVDAVTSRPAIMLWDNSTKKWREQPDRVDGDGSLKTISAREWGFGKMVLVDDRRPAPSFKDTTGHWARPAINSLAVRGVVNGFTDGTFGPDQVVTRAQFVSLLAAALQWPAPESAPTFKDSIPGWARPAVSAAVSRGVVSGYPDGTFAPDARITRSEMAVIINRALGLSDIQGKNQYTDAGSIPDFARDAVAKVSEAGLLQGSDGYFRPRDGATRAETAVAINRLLDWWTKQ